MYLVRRSAMLAVVCIAASCRNDVQPDQVRLNGTYALESVTGNGPATGSLLFMASGLVIRTVHYRLSDGSLSAEYVAVGTFRGSTNAIDFKLRENGGSSSYVWSVSGSVEEGGVVVLRYPDPADGWIAERYRPQ
jgi:hypothetical protein